MLALQCAPPHKLYGLYLVDSIAKNVGAPYTTLFASNMPQVSCRDPLHTNLLSS